MSKWGTWNMEHHIILDSGDILYDGHIMTADQIRLEHLQTRTARLVTGALYGTSSERLLEELGWDKLKTRREIHKLIYFKELTDEISEVPIFVKELIPARRQDDTSRHLRNASDITPPLTHLVSYKSSFIPNTINKWNNLPKSLRSLPNKSFRKAITQTSQAYTTIFFTFGCKAGNILHTSFGLVFLH